MFIGTTSQIVTELGKCYDPKHTYDLSEKEVECLSNRGFLSLFGDVPAPAEEPIEAPKKGK